MEKVAVKFPLTHAALQELALPGTDKVHLPGTFEDFLYLLNAAEFSVEYQPKELILMSYASPSHEQIVANLLGIFYMLFKNDPDFRCFGSNRPVYIPELQASYNPDTSIVRGTPQYHEYLPGRKATLNPWLVAEIASPSTERFDQNDKLRRYKKIASLQYILYLYQDGPELTLHYREPKTNRWAAMDYDAFDQTITLEEHSIVVHDIYAKVDFTAA